MCVRRIRANCTIRWYKKWFARAVLKNVWLYLYYTFLFLLFSFICPSLLLYDLVSPDMNNAMITMASVKEDEFFLLHFIQDKNDTILVFSYSILLCLFSF